MAIKALETRYGGRRYRSRTEARWGVFFDCCGIPFQYEADGFDLPGGAYLPDFWLPTFQLFVEIKGTDPTAEERRKCVELAEASDRAVLLAVGAPEARFQITWFDTAGEHEDVRYVIARDRRSDAGFWLLADTEGQERWMGGGDVTLRRWGPMLSGALENAYATALSERFDGEAKTTRYAPIPDLEIKRLGPEQQERAA